MAVILIVAAYRVQVSQASLHGTLIVKLKTNNRDEKALLMGISKEQLDMSSQLRLG